MNLLIFDTETTGLKNAELIEFAGIVKYSDGTIKDSGLMQQMVYNMCPIQKILPSSIVIHGITPEKAKEYESPDIVVPRIFAAICKLPKPLVLVAHNIAYDVEIMNSSFQKYMKKPFQPKLFIDTLKLAKHLIPDCKIGGYKLDAIFYYLYPDRLDEMLAKRAIHRALDDCELTYDVLIGLKKIYDKQLDRESTWEEVIALAAAPMNLSETEWKFGKHKGTKLKNTPKGYVNWCLTSDFGKDPRNADIIYTLKKLHGIKPEIKKVDNPVPKAKEEFLF